MFILGFIAAICYIPGWTGATIPSQWPILTIALLPSLWRRGPFTSLHLLGIVFVTYAIVSMTWATNLGTSVMGVWYVIIWALAFWLGTTLADLRHLWQGIAYGVVISSLVAAAQYLGYHGIFVNNDEFAGLYFNSTVLGAACGLMLIACYCHRMWWPMPFLTLGLVLSHSRGGIFILAVGLASRIHWLLSLALVIILLLTMSFLSSPSDLQRLEIWGVAFRHLPLFGWGPDAFNDFFAILPRRPWMTPTLYHLEYAHNDILQLWFEYGIAGIIPITLMALALTRSGPASAILIGYASLSIFFFPLYAPLLAFIGCVCAGHLLRGYDPIRSFLHNRRQRILLWDTSYVPHINLPWQQDIPMATRHPHTEA